MKKGLAWLLGIVAVLVLTAPLFSQSAPNTISPAKLQGLSWVFSVLQTFSAGINTHAVLDSNSTGGPITTLSGSTPLVSGASGTVPLAQTQINYTMADPTTAVTVGVAFSAASCNQANHNRFYAYYTNRGGSTSLSPATADQFGAWSGSKIVPLTRPSDFPPTAEYWTPAYSSDNGTTVKRCATSGFYTAIGTATVNCTCAAAGSTITGQANSTGTRTIFQIMDGEVRFPSYTSGTPFSLTEGARRLGFGLGYLTFSPDSGTTFSDALTTNGQSRLVCPTCRYATADAAIASYSDQAVSKPYTIYLLPATYGDISLGKSYTKVVGLGMAGSVIINGTLTIGGDVTESGISNLKFIGATTAPIRGSTNTVPTTFYLTNNDIGSLASSTCTIDVLHELGGYSGRIWLSGGNRWLTCWDGIFIAEDARFISSGDTFIGDNTNVGTANQQITIFNTLSDTAEYDISGASIWVRQTQSGSVANGWVYNSLGATNNGTIPPRVAIAGSRIYMQSTNASASGTLGVINLGSAGTTTIKPQLTLTGTDVDLVASGSSEKLVAIKVAAASNHAGWNVSVNGGGIRRSGGDTANSYDVDTAETASGFSVDLYGVRHEGKYSAAGGTLRAFVPMPNGSSPTIDTLGQAAVDTTANQLLYYSGGAARVLDPVLQECRVISDVTSADDNFEWWMATTPVTVTSVWCRCRGTCSTMATFTLEDRAGNGMTITGTNPTCATTGNSTPAAVTANNGLVAGEGLAFDVTNTPNPATDEYTLCVTYTIDRQ